MNREAGVHEVRLDEPEQIHNRMTRIRMAIVASFRPIAFEVLRQHQRERQREMADDDQQGNSTPSRRRSA